jgi:hypothetical protein
LDLDRLGAIDTQVLTNQVLAALARLGRARWAWLAVETVGRDTIVRDPVFGDWLYYGPPERIATTLEQWRVEAGVEARARPTTSADLDGSPALRRQVSADVEHLSQPPGLPVIDEDIDRAARLLAHATMRGFARRLPGFEAASLGFLMANFLSGQGYVEFERDSVVVSISHIPLEIVLRMAGVLGRPYRVPWLSDRLVTVQLAPSDT